MAVKPEKIAYYKAQGLCPFCSEHRKTDGKLYCAVCTDRKNKNAAGRKEWYRAQGQCPECSEHRPLEPGRKFCRVCMDKHASYQNRHHQRAAGNKEWYRSQGQCPECSEHRPLEPGRKFCRVCMDKHASYQNRHYHAAREKTEVIKRIVVPSHKPIYDIHEDFNAGLKRHEARMARMREEYQRKKREAQAARDGT